MKNRPVPPFPQLLSRQLRHLPQLPPRFPIRPPPTSSPSSKPGWPIVSSGSKKSSADWPSFPHRPTRAEQNCCAKRSPKAASRTSTCGSNRSSSFWKTSGFRPPRPIKPTAEGARRAARLLLKADRDKELSSQRDRIRKYIKEVDRMIRMQKGVRARTEGGDELKSLGNDQQRIAADTGKLGGDISKTDGDKTQMAISRPSRRKDRPKPDDKEKPKSDEKQDPKSANKDKPKPDSTKSRTTAKLTNSPSQTTTHQSPATNPSRANRRTAANRQPSKSKPGEGQPSEGKPSKPSNSPPSDSPPSQGNPARHRMTKITAATTAASATRTGRPRRQAAS